MRIVLEVRSNHIPQIVAGMQGKAAAAVAKAVFEAEAAAKTFVAVDTGTLKGSITAQVDGLEGAIFTGVDYAPYQEFGTYKMPAHPFFIPAIESVRETFLSDMADIFNG